jgi:putative Mg2+ transporter-C (MgtC) family protein
MVVIGKMLAAVLVGLLLGYARRMKSSAGMRTFALLCMGATIFSVVSVLPFHNSDPTRVMGQIVTGIGFLGLGVIFKHKGKTVGLTTAATVWVTAALGILIGLGMWTEVIAGTVLTMITLYSKKPLKKAHLEYEE